MKLKFGLIAIFSVALLPMAQSQVSLDGEIRPRTEFRNGYKKPLADTLNPALVTLQRTRMSLDYQTQVLKTHITLQDAHIWGASDGKTNQSKVEVAEAWAEYLIASGLSIQVGRQPLKYDDQRLLSASNWSNTGLAHDMMLIKYKANPKIQAHAGFAYNNVKDTLLEVDYTIKKFYKTMGFLWLSKEFDNGLSLSAIAIEEGLQKTGDYEIVYPRFTGGGNLLFKNDSSRFSGQATYYLQKGKSSAFDDLDAYMLAAKIGYRFSKLAQLTIGIDYTSGTSPDEQAGKSKTFNKLYGSNHAFEGNMDYWTSIPKSGLTDMYASVCSKLTSKMSLDLTYHQFRLNEQYLVGSVEIDQNMGSEIDLIYNFNVNKQFTLQAGYCQYFESSSTDDFLKQSNVDVRSPQWAYVMLTFKPNFYKTPTDKK